MRKNTSVKEKEKDHRWALFSGDPKTIAMRTLPLMRMCINSGVNIVKKNHEMQHGNCTKVFTSSTGRTKKIRVRSSNQKLLQELSPRHDDQSWGTDFGFFSGVSMHMMSKSDIIHEEQHFGNRKSLVRFCSELINHYDRRGYRDLDMFITVQVLEDSLAALFVGAVCDERGYPYERKDQQSPTSTNSGKNISCKSEIYVHVVVRRELLSTQVAEAMQMQHQETESKIFQTGFNRLRMDLYWQILDHPAVLVKQSPTHFLHNSPARPSNKAGGKNNLFTHFPKDPVCDVCKRTKITRAPCRRNPESREDRIPEATQYGDARAGDHKVLNEENESRLHHRHAGGSTRFGYSVGTKLSVQKQDCTRYDEKFAVILTSPESKRGLIYTEY